MLVKRYISWLSSRGRQGVSLRRPGIYDTQARERGKGEGVKGGPKGRG